MKTRLAIYITALIISGLAVNAQVPPVTMLSTRVENSQIPYDPLLDEPRVIPKRKLPAAIQHAFQNKFPEIKKAKWRIEEKDLYAADFIDVNRENVSAYFNSEGVLMQVSILKSNDKIRPALSHQINSQLSNIEEIIEVRDYFNEEIFYVVNTIENNEIIEHYFDADGNKLEKENESVESEKVGIEM
jgi:hypothetical protein